MKLRKISAQMKPRHKSFM